MKRLGALLGVMVLVFSADLVSVALAGDKDKLDKIEYYPLKVGTKWDYLVNGKKVTVTVTAHETMDGVPCAKLETDAGGVPITEHLGVQDGYLVRVRANNQKVEPPFKLMKLPLKSGEQWNNDSKLGAFTIAGKMAVTEDKKTKVGNSVYDTMLVTSSDLKVAGQDATMKSWFDKNKGLVKQTYVLAASGVEINLELTNFTPGK
jgi:hypothetical protein